MENAGWGQLGGCLWLADIRKWNWIPFPLPFIGGLWVHPSFLWNDHSISNIKDDQMRVHWRCVRVTNSCKTNKNFIDMSDYCLNILIDPILFNSLFYCSAKHNENTTNSPRGHTSQVDLTNGREKLTEKKEVFRPTVTAKVLSWFLFTHHVWDLTSFSCDLQKGSVLLCGSAKTWIYMFFFKAFPE